MRSTKNLPPNQIVSLATLAAVASHTDSSRLSSVLETKLGNLPLNSIREAFLMLHLFAGFPASIEAFSELKRVMGGEPLPMSPRSVKSSYSAGLSLCKRVYGGKFKELLRSLDPDLSAWILEYGYGTVLRRPGLSPRDRELVAIAILAANGWKRQFTSHVIGCRNLGASEVLIMCVVNSVLAHIGQKGPVNVKALARKALRAQKNRKTT